MSAPITESEAGEMIHCTPTDELELDPQLRALARAHAYGLLAKLMVRGIDRDLLSQVLEIPALAKRLPASPDLDELAAEHHQMMLHQLFPYAGVFLDEEATTGGDATTAVMDAYASFGFSPRLDELAGDHLGVELSALGFLCGAEADAREDDAIDVAERLRDLQRAFIDEHLLTWLPALIGAARAYPAGFWTGVLDIAFEVIADHRAALGEVPDEFSSPLEAEDVDDIKALLDDERTGLREIAEFLLTPRRSGLFFSRDDISTLSRGVDLPRGFGARQLMLTNLMRSAADYERVPELLARLESLVFDRGCAYDRAGRELGLEAAFDPWLRRAARTRLLLRRVARAAAPQTA